MVSRVAAVYGPAMLRGYDETRDGWIPWPLFLLHARDLRMILAMRRQEGALAAGLGMAGAEPAEWRKLGREAWPDG